jgi:hypothetical protein
MSDREEEGSSRSGDEENDLSMLVVQEEEDEDAEQEGGGGGQTIQIDGTVLRAIAAAAQRNGESVSVGALLRRYLEVISGQNGGLGLGMGSEDEEEEDDDDDEAMSWMRGGGRGMRSRRRADEVVCVCVCVCVCSVWLPSVSAYSMLHPSVPRPPRCAPRRSSCPTPHSWRTVTYASGS